jgi:WhiB family redox-sensing transcriptional regulator
MARATCRATVNADEIFFPPKGQGHSTNYEVARAICARCFVYRECLIYAVYHKERYGMWGGYTPAERRAIPLEDRRRMRRWWVSKYGRR